MAGSSGGRSLEETPTWAVAVVCFALVVISLFIEHSLHLIGKWLNKKHKRALFEALEKLKSELMLLGFISLLLTVGQGPISSICVSEKIESTWHPCSRRQEVKKLKPDHEVDEEHRRRLLSVLDSGNGFRRILAGGGGEDKCLAHGKVSLVSKEGIHQLHIFIFVLAVFHVLYCILTMALGRAKMRRWKSWEKETKTTEYEFSNDPDRFRFARDTSFGKRHLNFWTKVPALIWIVCFFRQFIRSVPKVDYLTLRHGFIMAHLSPQGHSKFDFQKYINRSLEEDFKVVVGISPPIWFLAVLFLLFNTHGWHSYLWLPFIPLIIILLVGTKLQVIITKMGLRLVERDQVVKGAPVVRPGDDLFWFNHPRLILYLINFVLFQNAFQLAFFAWTLWQFGIKSCFHERLEDVIIRVSMGIIIQILCSYVTLPLYALVTQMGSSMKSTIFDEKVAKALKNWHHAAKKNIKHNKGSSRPGTPTSSRPGTPTRGLSPVHLLRNHNRGDMDSSPSTPRRSYGKAEHWDTDSASPSQHNRYGDDVASPSRQHFHNNAIELDQIKINNRGNGSGSARLGSGQESNATEHVIEMGSREFSFDRGMRPSG